MTHGKAAYEKPMIEITRFDTRDIVFAYATPTSSPTAAPITGCSCDVDECPNDGSCGCPPNGCGCF